MKLVTGIGGWPDQAGAQAVSAEKDGYDMVTCGELAHDSILTMTLAATATERVVLLTSEDNDVSPTDNDKLSPLPETEGDANILRNDDLPP